MNSRFEFKQRTFQNWCSFINYASLKAQLLGLRDQTFLGVAENNCPCSFVSQCILIMWNNIMLAMMACILDMFRLRQHGFQQTTFLNSVSWRRIFILEFKLHWYLSLRVQLMIKSTLVKKWLDAQKSFIQYLKQWWPNLLTHICITRPQRVNEDHSVVLSFAWNWQFVVIISILLANYQTCLFKMWFIFIRNQDGQGSFCVCPPPMREDVTM